VGSGVLLKGEFCLFRFEASLVRNLLKALVLLFRRGSHSPTQLLHGLGERNCSLLIFSYSSGFFFTDHASTIALGDFMTTEEIIEIIQAEIDRLEQVRTLLSGRITASAKRGRPVGSTTAATAKPRRKMSAEGRARIAAAQRARWANTKRK
jgi:hypothetical protein